MIGVLIFNEILVIPFCGFNRYTKKAISKKEQEIESEKIKKSYSLNY